MPDVIIQIKSVKCLSGMKINQIHHGNCTYLINCTRKSFQQFLQNCLITYITNEDKTGKGYELFVNKLIATEGEPFFFPNSEER